MLFVAITTMSSARSAHSIAITVANAEADNHIYILPARVSP
jgi:hypothetical protein